jgi:hypothetical protein
MCPLMRPLMRPLVIQGSKIITSTRTNITNKPTNLTNHVCEPSWSRHALSIKIRPSYELNQSQDTRDSIPIPQTSHYEHTGRLRTSSQNFVFSARLVDDLVCVSRIVRTGITWSGTLRTSPPTFRISEQPGRISTRDPDITFTDLRRFIPFLIWR